MVIYQIKILILKLQLKNLSFKRVKIQKYLVLKKKLIFKHKQKKFVNILIISVSTFELIRLKKIRNRFEIFYFCTKRFCKYGLYLTPEYRVFVQVKYDRLPQIWLVQFTIIIIDIGSYYYKIIIRFLNKILNFERLFFRIESQHYLLYSFFFKLIFIKNSQR